MVCACVEDELQRTELKFTSELLEIVLFFKPDGTIFYFLFFLVSLLSIPGRPMSVLLLTWT